MGGLKQNVGNSLSVVLENRSKMMRPSSDLMTRVSRKLTWFSENSMVNFMVL